MPKSSVHTQSAVPVTQLHQNKIPRSRWDVWAAKNALPKNRNFPKPIKPEPTRFQKRGPMSTKDKDRFLIWALKRCLPKKQLKQPKKTDKSSNRRRCQLQQRKLKNVTNIMSRIHCLSIPKWQRTKYIPQPQLNYPFSPKIHYRNIPHHDKGRPFQNVKLPHWWYHEELEMDFWRRMRFPISRCALKYKITCNIMRIAYSNTYPGKPHCPYPPRDYSPPDRIKMKPRQWQDHLKRLDYLADASFKVTRQFKVKI